MRRSLLIPLVACLAIVMPGCAANRSTDPPPAAVSAAPTSAAPTKEDAVFAVAGTAAAVADALDVAPPASVTSKTTIDEKGVRLAFLSFDGTLHVIDGFLATGVVVRNSPPALVIRRGVLTVKQALIAASAAQRAGAATSYRDALMRAKTALTAMRAAIASQGASL